ncbi:hypothetical protein ACFVWF_32180 [Rhodococcus qingshengii]|uniref:hypothetical protein n=1 Tax=Rhodococcus qingshengii TaxID=334542 RepID=UPI0036DD98A0
MTAPDPGLTDLIATHVLSGPYIEYDSDGHHVDDFYLCGENCKWTSNEGTVNRSAFAAHAAHVALVVEQHTKGRIAELDWDALVAAIPDGWELRESAQLEEVSRVRQRDLEASQATTARWRARAEKAEATIARVEKLQGDLFQQGGNLIAQWGAARLIRAALQEGFICAALEGEQQ